MHSLGSLFASHPHCCAPRLFVAAVKVRLESLGTQLLLGSDLFPHRVPGRDSAEDCGCGGLNEAERLGERLSVAVVKLDVIGGCGVRFETDGRTYDECHCFRLRFSISLRRGTPALAMVQPFMCKLMKEDRKLLPWCEAGEDPNPTAG